jgi:hypothetical protein
LESPPWEEIIYKLTTNVGDYYDIFSNPLMNYVKLIRNIIDTLVFSTAIDDALFQSSSLNGIDSYKFVLKLL